MSENLRGKEAENPEDWDKTTVGLQGEPLKAILELRHIKEEKVKRAVTVIEVVNDCILNELKRVKGGAKK